jgi:hypothetical protein
VEKRRIIKSLPLPILAVLGTLTAMLIAPFGTTRLIAFIVLWIGVLAFVWRLLYVAEAAQPSLVPTIQEAFDQPQDTPKSWLIFMKVTIEDPDPEPMRVADWETRLWYHGQTHEGQKFQHPQGLEWSMRLPDGNEKRFLFARFIENQEQVPGRDHIECVVPSMFYDVSYENFDEVTLGLRVKGVGGQWSAWHDFQPPKYTANRQSGRP